MKAYTTFSILLFCSFLVAQAQSPVEGMKYQAVARDLEGNILAFEEIVLEVGLHSSFEGQKDHYREEHNILTNEFGLFTITIGKGDPKQGDFNSIPWESMDVFMAISMYDDEKNAFATISDSKLLAVPYAYHAISASRVVEDYGQRGADFPGAKGNIPWFTNGNKGINDLIDKLGTLEAADLVIITDDIERLRILADGDIMTSKSSDLHAQANLFASRDVELNTREGNTHVHGALTVDKTTTLNDDLSVENSASTNLTGTLDVAGNTALNSNLDVVGNTHIDGQFMVDMGSTSHLTGDLRVDGITNIESSFYVNNGSPTFLSGNLTVLGLADIQKLKIEDSLNAQGGIIIGGETVMQDQMSLTHNSDDYIAYFTNTNSGSGDGLKISLGKTHPRWNGAQVEVPLPGIDFVQNMANQTKLIIKTVIQDPGSLGVESFEPIGSMIIQELDNAGQTVTNFASASCNLTNDVIGLVNTELGLPKSIGRLNVTSSVLGLVREVPPIDAIPSGIWSDIVDAAPTIRTPAFTISGIDPLTCPAGEPNFNFLMPNISLLDVPNSLTTENQFIAFTDESDRQLGAVRAESITNWCDRYLDLNYFMTVLNSFAGVTEISIDPVALASTGVKYGINGATVLFTLVNAYNSIGVEYSSGFGDYAEWLERLDHAEKIHTGDIVGVIGGKITKDLSNAEQVMAVSFKPIVLGNSPEKDREHLGNKVAFMGQIPVKVLGPVETGDYIIGNTEVAGYGRAVKPVDMSPEDFRLAVGRSWAANPTPGPKMVNTVVGVHNGDYMHILASYKEKLDNTEQRLSSIEERIEILFPEVTNEK